MRVGVSVVDACGAPLLCCCCHQLCDLSLWCCDLICTRVGGGTVVLLVWGCGGGGVVSIGVVVWWVLICGVSEVVECIIKIQRCFSEV